MKNFRISKYIRKILPLIVAFCIAATYVIHLKLKSSNTFVASEVIHYNDEQAEKGKTPTGDTLDVNEIKSSAVLSKVVERMGLTGIYSVDSLISRVSITPLPDKDKLAQKEAKLEDGEEYIYEPSTYIVSFTATNSEGSIFARTVIDEILDVYFSEYSRKYVNIAPADNTIDNLNSADYDYIEMMELIESNIDNTLQTLYQRAEQNSYFSSTETGRSFTDLADDFNYIRSVEVSSLFSKIFKYQVTKNKSVLISDYTTRIDNNNISNEKETGIVNDVLSVITAYVDKMRDSGNTNISSDYILDNVHERNLTDSNGNAVSAGDQTVTYDELIYSWRDHNETKEHSIIDTAYSQYIIDTFQKCTGACAAGECALSGVTCTELHNEYYPQIKQEIESGIESLLAELTQLYDATTKTNDEYNEYLGASYISVLSSSSVKQSVNVNLYTMIAFFFLVIICCGGAIVIGRMSDIINYVMYTDRMTGLFNRAYFDKYLKSMDKKLLDDGVVYCMIDIANLVSINKEHSRNVGDEIITLFSELIKESFGKTDASFIYNGNGSFIITINNSDYITVEDIIKLFELRLGEREENRNVRIEYKVGIAEAFRSDKTARGLFSETIKNKKTVISDLSESEE